MVIEHGPLCEICRPLARCRNCKRYLPTTHWTRDGGDTGEVCDTCLDRAERPTIRRSVENTLQQYEIEPAAVDLRQFVTDNAQRIRDIVDEAARRHGGNCKLFLSTGVDLHRVQESGTQETTAGFRTSPVLASEYSVDDLASELEERLDHYNRRGSNWLVYNIRQFVVHTAAYSPLAASSYFKLPQWLKEKKALVNIKNNDELCYLWSILAHIHAVDGKNNPNRVSHYEPHLNELQTDGIVFPMTIRQIPKFEDLNPSIAVNVYTWDKDRDIVPLFVSKHHYRQHEVDLLLAYTTDDQGNEKWHYVTIRDMSKLVAHRSKHDGKTFVCRHCVHPFRYEHTYLNHLEDCRQQQPTKVILPDPDDENACILRWRGMERCHDVPFVIYGDLECFLTPDPSLDDAEEHIVSGFSLYTVSQFPEYQTDIVVYSGPDPMTVFFDTLLEEQERINKIMSQNLSMTPLTQDQLRKYIDLTECPTCHRRFTDDNFKVRHHCHTTGRFLKGKFTNYVATGIICLTTCLILDLVYTMLSV